MPGPASPAPQPHCLQRRAWLRRLGQGAGLWAAAGLGCAVPAARGPSLETVAPGLAWLPGTGGEVAPENLGRTGHCCVITGRRGVLVVDSGVSHAHGLALLQALRQHSARPPLALLLTQVRQEFVFGASAFQEAGVPVWMHPAAARLMAARCDTCLKQLRRVLGEPAMAGSRVVQPDRLIDPQAPPEGPDSASSALSALIDRPLRLLAFGPDGHSASPGALAVFDEPSGTLLAGALADAQRIPDVQDADPTAWRTALQHLQTLPLQRVLPGHGPLGGPEVLADTRRYLDALDARVAQLFEQGLPLSEVADAATLPEFAHWDQADTIHRRNAALAYLRHERRQWLQAP